MGGEGVLGSAIRPVSASMVISPYLRPRSPFRLLDVYIRIQ
jgi:hypothetical protein